MANKAIITGINGIVKDSASGKYILYINFACTNGDDNIVTDSAQAQSSTFTNLLWRSIISQAVKDKCQNSFSITIDQVMFPDFGVLGI